MAYTPIENQLGIQPLYLSSATQNHDLGAIIRARDPVYGEGEFIYLLGVIGTAIGSVVIWDGQSSGAPTYQTALAPATQFTGQPLAVSMSANAAGQYGWYQISGQAVCATNGTLAINAPVYLAGSGQLTTTQATGLQVLEAVSVTASGTPSSGLAVVEIDRPFAQGQDQGPIPIGTARLPAFASTISILTSDIEVGINTSTGAVTANLPAVAAWAAANQNGLDLVIFDFTGNAATHNISFGLNGSDTFVQSATPSITIANGKLSLRPILGTSNQWYVRGIN